MGIRQEVAFKQNSEVFKRLEEVANVATLTPQEKYDYEADIKMVRDTINQIRGAYEDGEEKGRAEGRAEGRVEGRAEGRAEGLLEGKLDTARRMKAGGLSTDLIVAFTGLTEAEILAL